MYLYTPTSQIRTPKMQAPPSTGQLSHFVIKCLKLGVVIGVTMACSMFSYLQTFPTYGHPLVPRCPDKKGKGVHDFAEAQHHCINLYALA